MSTSLSNRVISLADGVDRIVGAVCGVMIVGTIIVLLAVLGTNVVVRYALEQGGITWVSEIPEQLFPWMIAAGIILAVQHGAHIAVDVLFALLGPAAGRVMAICIHLLVAVAYGVLFSVVLNVADIVSIEHSPLLQLSRSWGYYALAFAAGGTALGNLLIALRVALIGIDGLPKASAEESPL